MSQWLRSPRTFAQGTRMTFAGLSNPQDRADVMLYMNQNGGRLTVPPPPAAGAAEGNAAAGNEAAPASNGATEASNAAAASANEIATNNRQ
jgi:cytochrome c